MQTQRRRRAGTVVVVIAAVVAAVGVGVTPVAGQSGETKTITATVETADGTAVSGATVTATWSDGETSATTAGNGKAFIDVPWTAVSFSVDHPDYTRNFALRRSVDDGTDEVSIRVAPAVTFSYRVSNPQGNAVEGVLVTVVDSGGREVTSIRTDASGRASTEQVEAGEYQIRLQKPGFLTVERNEDVSTAVTRQVQVERGNVVLAVDVTDPRSGEAIADAQVQIADTTARTDDSGRATLSVPVNSRVSVQVTRQGYGDTTREVAVAESERTVQVGVSRVPSLTIDSINRRVVAGESTRVTVVDAYGEPAPNATVAVDGESVAETDADGEATVPLEDAGEYQIRATTGRITSNAVTVEAVAEARDTTETTTAVETGDGGLPSFGSGPGFGVLAALVALLLVGLVARYSRR